MTARELKELRECLSLDPFAVAAILGVHVGTIYRWETLRGQIPYERSVSRIVDPLWKRLNERQPIAGPSATKLGERIRSQLLARGELAALAVILDFILETP